MSPAPGYDQIGFKTQRLRPLDSSANPKKYSRPDYKAVGPAAFKTNGLRYVFLR